MRTNRNIALVFNFVLLIMVLSCPLFSIAQEQKGSSQTAGLNSPVNYEATDSIVADIPNQIVRLYGSATVQYEEIELTADRIEIDLKNNEVTATYSLDSLGNPVGKPVFSAEGEESRSDYIKYNFKTKKGFIKEVRMQQGEGYIQMAQSKVQPNEEIHFKNGKFTTCDKEDPHFHFNLSRAIVIPNKRIVTGPVYMEILHVPTPLAAPFGFFPNSDTKKAGLILPEFQNNSTYGFGLENLGYYFPLGQYWETYAYGSIFTTGSWAAQNITNYYQKYRHKGGFSIRFEQFRGKFYDDLDTRNKWTINWNHNQDPKAHPTLKFTTNINYVSDNTAKTSLDAINTNYFNNTFNSSINVSKLWRTSRFSGTMGLQTTLQQNSQSGNYVMELPRYNLSVQRFDLGVFRKNPIGEKWYEKVNVTYSMNARNSIQAPDTVFTAEQINQLGDYALNGIEQKAVVQSNLRLFQGRAVFTPSANYRELWNFQYEDREWNEDLQKVDTSEFSGFKTSRDISFAGNLSSNFYGYYKLKGKQKMKFRHVASPSVSFTYRPDIGLHEEIQVDTTGNLRYYSPFSQSLYREAAQGESGRINFSLNNTLEMKKRVKNDTINESMRAFKLVDAFSIGGNYDFLKDSMNLSDLALAFRTSKFFNIFSFQSNATLSPYSWVDSTGRTISTYAWNDDRGIGRVTSARAVINAGFSSSKKSNKDNNNKNQEVEKNAGDDPIKDPDITNFSLPWLLNLSYNINYTRTPIINDFGSTVDSFRVVQTVAANGNLSINDKWKLDMVLSYDIQSTEVTQFNLGIWRDLHCWETSIYYQQFGPFNPEPGNNLQWSVLFKIGVKASMFQDIKYDHTFSGF